MEVKLKSLITKELNKNIILQICKLKNTHWKFTLNKQILWFKENVKTDDIHNLCYLNKKLIGYTALRNIYYVFDKKDKSSKKKLLLFDTLIVDPKYRKKNLGVLMMKFNNLIINNENKPSYLICKKNMIKFYRSNNWILISKKEINIQFKSQSFTSMIFNFKKKNNKKINIILY